MDDERRSATATQTGLPQSFATSEQGARAFLAALVDSSGDAIIGKTLDGIIWSWNAGAQALFGYAADEVIGRAIHLLVPDERLSEEDAILEKIRRGQRVPNFDTVRVRKDGSRVQISVSVSPIRDANGRVVGASKIARDMTQWHAAMDSARRSRRAMEAIVDASPLAISVCEPDGRVRLWNRGATKSLGWTADQTIGRHDPSILPQHHPDFLLALQNSLAGRPLSAKETLRKRADESIAEVLLWSSPLETAEGETASVLLLAVDVTEQRRTERALAEENDRFRLLADNIAQFAWMADSQGWIFWYNQRWFDYTGTTLEEMQGWGWRKVHHPDYVDGVVERVRRAFANGTTWEDTFPLRGRDGSYRWFLSRALPIRDAEGRVTRWFGTNTDISERMQMESALRESDRRKDEFLAMLAHELRNPLAPIRTGISLLREVRNDPALTERVHDAIDRQSARLARLVDDLIDISRVTRGKLELRCEPVDLRDLVREAIDASAPALTEGKHQLAVELPELPLRVHADPTRVVQVFSNLLNNAAKYTRNPNTIFVQVWREGSEAVTDITDPGQGIAHQDLDRIFELFAQVAPARGALNAGLGVGLTLVKKLTEMHGGRVQAHSDGIGAGTRMRVCLPLCLEEARADPARVTPKAVPVSDTRLRVLIADDNRDAGEALRSLLDALGHATECAFDGNQTLCAARENPPDLLILDLGMPGIDGLEVARSVRAEPWGQRPYLVALTGWGRESDRERTKAAGFDCHVVKPASRADIGEVLRAAIAKARTQAS